MAKKSVKIEAGLSPEQQLIVDVEMAVSRYYVDDRVIIHGEYGRQFLAYLKGEAVFHRIDEHGTRYEPPTCATGHLIAERVLRIVENGVRCGDAVPSDDALTQLEHLADRAGVHFARTAITIQDEVPF